MDKKCGALTFDMVQEASNRAVNTDMIPLERIIGHKAYGVLKRIRQKVPGWDNWTVETEIWWKAYSLGILEDE